MPYCELTGKTWLAGNKVSHSHVRTHRRYNLNMRAVNLNSDILKRKFRMKIAISTQRTLDLHDSFDKFLLSCKNHKLSTQALSLKKAILRKINNQKLQD